MICLTWDFVQVPSLTEGLNAMLEKKFGGEELDHESPLYTPTEEEKKE